MVLTVVHRLTRQLRLHSFGAVTRRKQIQSPLEAIGSLYTFLIDESWVCNTQPRLVLLQGTRGRILTGVQQNVRTQQHTGSLNTRTVTQLLERCDGRQGGNVHFALFQRAQGLGLP